MPKLRILILIIITVGFTPVNFASASSTSGTIDSTDKYAYSENIGWLDFGASGSNITITDSAITGYAYSENIGWISLNCSNDSSCATVDYKIANDGAGTLSGYAWSENAGWINFAPSGGGVVINSSGEFTGYAYGENTGWIIFNCASTNSCATVDYKVKTDWRPQSSRPACNNSSDDDGDGLADYPTDPGCSSLTDTDETDPASAGSPAITPAAAGDGAAVKSIGMNKTALIGEIAPGGVNILAYINSQGNFFISSGSSHSFKIKNIDMINKKATVVFNSRPITAVLNLAEEKKVDLDGDGVNDIEVKFSSLVINRVELTMKEIKNREKTISYENKLVKYSDSPKVYLIKNNKKRWIINEEVFISNGYQWGDIIVIPDSNIFPNAQNILGVKIESSPASVQTYQFKSFLTIGSAGEEVRELQKLLKQLGYFKYPSITGYYGSVTEQAVKEFQAANGIEQAGFAGPKTRAALNRIVI